MPNDDAELAADPHTKDLIARFRKCTFDGVVPGQYLGRGATYLVFLRTYEMKKAEIKVFDPKFLDENPTTIEEERIRRQLAIRSHPHPHLVEIYNAGFSESAGAFFLAMQFCEGHRLSDVISTIPRDRIRQVISQIASAAEHLEKIEFVHRDIKPDNIVLSSDYTCATLL